MVDCGMIQRKRKRYFFKTKEEAETKSAQLRVARKNEGVAPFSLPEALRVQALEAQKLLEPFGVSVIEAVKLALPQLRAEANSITVAALAGHFLHLKKEDGASGRYMQDLRNKLDHFAKAFGSRSVASLLDDEVDDWLRNLKSRSGKIVAPLTRNNFRRVLQILFNYAVSKRYCISNPVLFTTKAKEIENPVGVLTVEQLRSLLQTCPHELVPFFAIGGFAGLRTSEIQRLDWTEIHLEERHIEVLAKKAKTAKRRLVTIRPNLFMWLKPHARSEGAVVPENFRELFLAAKTKANLHTWPHNALRHSFASYCLAHENNAQALALELGHTTTNILFEHYRKVVLPAEAKKYWAIRP
ncbi:MAG: tyrosine-type recombinase/integrase [Prosthecobacter sp.]